MRQLLNCNMKFESVVVLHAKLIEKLGDQVPNTITFDVGYFEGSQHSKIWIVMMILKQCIMKLTRLI